MEKQNDLEKILNNKKNKGIIFDFDGVLIDLDINWKVLKSKLENYYFSKTGKRNNFSPLINSLIQIKKNNKIIYDELKK